jgi:hypothetical protein
MGYTEAPSNELSSLQGEPQFPPSFPQPQCSCEHPTSLEDQPPPESGTSQAVPYAEEIAEPSTFVFPQPEGNDGTFTYQQQEVNKGTFKS